MADSYVVTAAAAYVYRTDGTVVFLLAGAPVPDDATAESILNLLDKDMIGAVPDSVVVGGIPADVPGVPVLPVEPKTGSSGSAGKSTASAAKS